MKYLINCPIMHHDKEKGTYTVRDQDMEFIKKWVDNIRDGITTGDIAAVPKKKVAPKANRKKRKAEEMMDGSGEESMGMGGEGMGLKGPAAESGPVVTRSGRRSKRSKKLDD